jgi:hypothetical protein
MSREPRIERTPGENWQVVQEGIKSGTPRKRAGTIHDRESPARGKDNCKNCERLTGLLGVLQR